MTSRLVRILHKLGPHGGARCIPVREYLEAQDRGLHRVEDEFYRGILLPNGVYKTTHAHRMDDLLPQVLSRVTSNLGDHARILDVACSSGVSTAELHRALRKVSPACTTRGTDLMLFANYVCREDGVGMLLDGDGHLLQVELGRWASPWKWRPRDRALRPLRSLRARQVVRADLETFRDAVHRPRPGYRVQRISFLSSLALGVDGLQFEEEDIMAPRVHGPFDLIRAANILNDDYFDRAVLREMATALAARLVPGGWMLVVRSRMAHPANRATLFQRQAGRLHVVERMNGGVEIGGLLEDLDISGRAPGSDGTVR